MEHIKRLTLAVAALLASVPLASAQDAVRYVHLDALGSVRAVSNEANVVIERHDYLPFGDECITGPCAANPGVGAGQPRKFTGKERDQETGLDYFGARYYGARIGRFTTIDPVYTWADNLADPQRWNRYAYVRNNPLRYVDPDGRQLYGPGSPTDTIAKRRLNDHLEGRITREEYIKQETQEGVGTVAVLLAVVPDPTDGIIGGLFAAWRLQRARAARDELAAAAMKQKDPPAAVTAGYNRETGEVAARCSGGRRCAEDHVVDALGGDPAKVRFTEATRPRTGKEQPICEACETKYGPDAFPSGAQFRSDMKDGPKQ